jgi:hypothetical protein
MPLWFGTVGGPDYLRSLPRVGIGRRISAVDRERRNSLLPQNFQHVDTTVAVAFVTFVFLLGEAVRCSLPGLAD